MKKRKFIYSNVVFNLVQVEGHKKIKATKALFPDQIFGRKAVMVVFCLYFNFYTAILSGGVISMAILSRLKGGR